MSDHGTDEARALGTEHGTRAAEEWLAEPYRQTVSKEAWDYLLVCLDLGDQSDLPQPDLSGSVIPHQWAKSGKSPTRFLEITAEYSVAFADAAEATIRARRCELTR